MKTRKIFAVGGLPGTGKTEIMKKFISTMEWEYKEPVKMLYTLYNAQLDVYLFGKYEEGVLFSGTDRYSMSIQPIAEAWIKENNSHIIFEGDRLFTSTFLHFVSKLPDTDFQILYLEVPKHMREARYKERGSNQSKQILDARATKYSKLRCMPVLNSLTKVMKNENYEDQKLILKYITDSFSEQSLIETSKKKVTNYSILNFLKKR